MACRSGFSPTIRAVSSNDSRKARQDRQGKSTDLKLAIEDGRT
jgi:hypothetical protein